MKSLILNIPTPCTQNWDTMEERSIGRHCNNCNKTVVDFTSFTDEQLVGFFQRSEGNICGRIEQHRLNKSFILPPEPKRNRIKWLYPLTAILSLFGLTKAQGQDTLGANEKRYLADRTEKMGFERDPQTQNVKQLYIEILISDLHGNPLNKNFQVRCLGHDSLKYTLEKGLIKIPTDQFNANMLFLTITNDDYYGNLEVNVFSLQRYYIVIGAVYTVEAEKDNIETIVMGELPYGSYHKSKKRRRSELSNFEMRTLNETLRYMWNQY